MDSEKSLVFGVTFLRYLYLFYQNCHWQCAGANFYSSHLLFERLYQEVAQDTDQLAERTVGVFGKKMLNFGHQFEVFSKINQDFPCDAGDYYVAFLQHGIKMEIEFQNLIESGRQSLQNEGKLSLGLDDLLMNHASRSEDRIYLLKQSLADV